MFKTIVVGVDGRDGGWDALSLAGRLLLLNGGELVAVRVLSLDYYVTRSGAPAYTAEAERDARAEIAERLAEAALEAEVRVIHGGSPPRALHDIAEERNADVIVIGSTHRGPLGRVFIGDRAAAVLHGSPCPVAVAPRGSAEQQWGHLERIGVGFDGGPEASRALAVAADLAHGSGARLVVRYAVASPINAVDFTAYDPDELERSKAYLSEEMARVLDGAGVEATGEITVGSPVDELVELSERVDLVVLGSRAGGPLRRTVAGSTAVGVMRRAHAPVLVVPRRAPSAAPREQQLGSTQPATTT